MEISLTKEYDGRFTDVDAVSYFVWLRFNKAAYESWSSVYQNMLIEASKTSGGDPKSLFRTVTTQDWVYRDSIEIYVKQ